jgi:hypothetical protein
MMGMVQAERRSAVSNLKNITGTAIELKFFMINIAPNSDYHEERSSGQQQLLVSACPCDDQEAAA